MRRRKQCSPTAPLRPVGGVRVSRRSLRPAGIAHRRADLTRQQADTLRTALGTQAVEQQVKMYARIAPTAKAESEAKTQVAQGVEPDTYRQLSAFGAGGRGR